MVINTVLPIMVRPVFTDRPTSNTYRVSVLLALYKAYYHSVLLTYAPTTINRS